MADIQWHEFDPKVFEQARQEGRPVLLVLTAHWCPHCRELLERSFTAPEVVRTVGELFVPIHADAERRPDVNERYGRGTWPTIAYLTPRGELISHDGFLGAEELAQRLRKAAKFFADNQQEIQAGLASLWRLEDGDGTGRTRSRHSARLNEQIVEDVATAIYEKFDHRYGGWGENSKFPHPEALDFALVLVAKRDDPQMREVVELTLDQMQQGGIHDRIDGGFFRYSSTPDWRSPNFEKVLDSNAMRLRCYLEGWQVFGKDSYRATAQGIVDWMLGFMHDAETGAFFGTQDADADYYQLDAEQRPHRPPPRLDRTIYTNWNAMAVSSLLKASVVLEAPELRDLAMRTLRFLLEELFDARDGVFHYWDGTFHLPGLLSDQAYLIRALVDASQHTGDADLLLPAERIAEQAIERQQAPEGGFFDILYDQRQPGSMRRRNRSILENSVMAEALLRLAYLSHRHEFHDVAVATLQAFTSDFKEYGYYVAGYGRAVDLIFYQPLVVTVVGDRSSPTADALRRAALAPYVPSRIVQMLDPAHDPVLLGRSGLTAEDQPVAHLGIGSAEREVARSPDQVLQALERLEAGRRG